MKHAKYSKEAVELIKSRMPDERYREFVDLFYGHSYTLQELAAYFYCSRRTMERMSSKVKHMVEKMNDIVDGDVKPAAKMTELDLLKDLAELMRMYDITVTVTYCASIFDMPGNDGYIISISSDTSNKCVADYITIKSISQAIFPIDIIRVRINNMLMSLIMQGGIVDGK